MGSTILGEQAESCHVAVLRVTRPVRLKFRTCRSPAAQRRSPGNRVPAPASPA